jgi:hypothetical protein
MKATIAALVLSILVISASAISQTRTTAQSIRGHFSSINQRVLEMAKDFPEDKYDYKLKSEMRSFGAVIVHIASGNVYAAKAGKGEKCQLGRA